MSTTIDEIAEFLDEQELSYNRHETEPVILLGFRIEPGTTSYRDREGDAHIGFVIQVREDGEYISVGMPWTWNLTDCPHKGAVLEALLSFQARAKLVRFDYDPDDGEVCANAEIGIEDSVFTTTQFHRLLKAVGNSVLELDPVIRHAMLTGEVDMHRLVDLEANDEDRRRLEDLATEAGGIEALEKLICGDCSSGDEPTNT